ncbi:MAG TPA: OmpA family protein [Chthoniobacter sp.]|nr:OmpA family protein [Chthoniobacter sp.]
MPETRGKCTNSTVCSLAQEGQTITAAGDPKCPECGATLQPLTPENRGGGNPLVIGAIWLIVALLGVGLGWKLSRMSNTQDAAGAAAAPSAKPATSEVSDAQRQEVLKRIDLMPNLSAANKERLYAYVERAQRIKRVMNVSFQGGGTQLSEAAIKKVVDEAQKPDFANEVRDPVVVFVVLGYADKTGDEKANLETSHDRAEHVAELLHKRCGVANVIQTVPMGSSELFDANNVAENRVAEVWAVLP